MNQTSQTGEGNRIFRMFLEGTANTFEIFLRKDFGQRYFTVAKFLSGLLVLLIYNFLSLAIVSFVYSSNRINFLDTSSNNNLGNGFFGLTSSDLSLLSVFNLYFFIVYLILYFILSLIQFKTAFERNRLGVEYHSYHLGDERFFFFELVAVRLNLYALFGNHPITSHLIPFYIQPFFLFSIGVLLTYFFPVVGIWFILGSFITYARGQSLYNTFRERILNLRDAKMESKYTKEVMEFNQRQGDRVENGEGENVSFKSPVNGFSEFAFSPGRVVVTPSAGQSISEAIKDNPNLAKNLGITNEKVRDVIAEQNKKTIK